jgi:solute carrier family 50 protein (sugar transporter)
VRTQLEVISLFFVFVWGSVGFVAAILEDKEQGIAIIGILGNIVVFGLFASPLSTFPKIVKRKDSSSINRPFAICQVLNCIVWVSYGLATNDIYLATPNFVGLLLGLAQVSLILLYPPKPVALESPAATKVLTGGEYSPFDAGSSS